MEDRFSRLDQEGHLVFESVHQRKDGTTFPVLMEVTVIKDAQGRPVSSVAYTLDISERKYAYEALRAAYARLQVMSREVQVAEETERRRLSRELHDEFGQVLSALQFDLTNVGGGLLKLRSPAAKALHDTVNRAMRTVDRLFGSLREVIAALRPAVLEALGLVPALDALAEQAQEQSGIRCGVVADPDALRKSLTPAIESTLYRMAQELLMNVVRHAKATMATITVSRAGGWVTLVVQDDGKGLNASAPPSQGHFGLSGLRERAELLGGRVVIRSGRGMGTSVTVRIPLKTPPLHRGSVTPSVRSRRSTATKRARRGETD